MIRIIHSRRIKWAGHVARMKKNAYRLLAGKTEDKETSSKKCRRVDYITMYLEETGWGGMDWIDMAQDRDQWGALVNTVINLRIS
jgi:hypothetical protein